MMKPTWEDEEFGIQLYLGDCLDVMPTLPKVDAVVTDPPYGIGFAYESHDDNESGWFDLMDLAIPIMRRLSTFVVMPCCKISRMKWWYNQHTPDWIIAWYKGSPGHRSHVGFNDWEPHVVWGKPSVAMHDYFHTKCGFDNNGHPCPKPLAWALWLCARAATDTECILDPFMGSGTTGVACVNLGRAFIGIEMEPKYFEISVDRIRKAIVDKQNGPLFAKHKPIKQNEMFGAKV